QAEDGIRDFHVTGVQTCALPILLNIAEKKSKQRVVNAYGSIPPFVNHLTAYKLTGNRYCLDTAIIQAHDYISEQVYSKNTEPVRSEERRVGKEWRSERSEIE